MAEKKKKKGKEKTKKPIQQGGNQETIALNASSNDNPSIKLPKAKYPCIICVGDHFHRDFPRFPRIFKEWSSHSHHPMSLTSGDHVGNTPSTSDSKVHGLKGKVRIPCRLCEGNHSLHLCPFLDEAKRVFDNRLTSPQRLPSGYKKLSLNPSLVDEPTDQNQPSVKTTLLESEQYESLPDQNQQVKVTADPISPSANRNFREESENDTVQVLFVTSDSNDLGGSPLVPSRQEENPPFLITQGVNYSISTVPPQVV